MSLPPIHQTDRGASALLNRMVLGSFFPAIRRKMLCYIMQFKEIYAVKICMSLNKWEQ